MIKGIAHICFTVRNLEESIAFYRDKLGMTEAFGFLKPDGQRYGIFLLAGGRNFIELFGGKLGEKAEGQPYRHLCLEVDDIQETVKTLRARGVEVTEPVRGSEHSWQAWVNDPDGNRIELHHYTPESKQIPFLK